MERISFTEVLDTETGEIVEQLVSEREQFQAAMAYAKVNDDVPLIRQNVCQHKSLRICITGAFEIKRADIVKKLNVMGYSVADISKKTEVLIVGTWGAEVGGDGVSEKYLKAIERGVQIIKCETSEEIFEALAKI